MSKQSAHNGQNTSNSVSSKDYEEKHKLILDAAVQAVLARGYDAVRLRDVSSFGGFSIGLIQHHFASREELFREALYQASSTLVRNFTESRSVLSSPWQRIEWLISQWSAVSDMQRHAQVWLAFADAARKHEDIEEHFSEIYQRWYLYTYEAVNAGIKDGSLNPLLPVEDAVSVFMAFFDGYEFQVANDRVEKSAEVLRRRATQLACALFRPTSV